MVRGGGLTIASMPSSIRSGAYRQVSVALGAIVLLGNALKPRHHPFACQPLRSVDRVASRFNREVVEIGRWDPICGGIGRGRGNEISRPIR